MSDPLKARHFVISSTSIMVPEMSGKCSGLLQGVVYPAGSDDAYYHTGRRDAVMVLPGPNGTRYWLTLSQIQQLFDAVGREP